MNAHHLLPPGVTVFERGWLSSNNILFQGPDLTALVDTAYVTHSAQTLALVDNALAGRRLDQIFNTHLHSDHCGGNAALQARYPQVHTFIPLGEAASVAAWDEDALSFKATGQLCPPFHFQGYLSASETIGLRGRLWQVHAAPGHDPHAVMLFEPDSRTLISADALWENGFGIAFPELIGESAFDDVAATLELIANLDPAVVIPGHGAVFNDALSALGRARRLLDSLRRDPTRHARHALKVLLKFKLLEVQCFSREGWNAWITSAPIFGQVQRRFFPLETVESVTESLLVDLVRAGAANSSASSVENR